MLIITSYLCQLLLIICSHLINCNDNNNQTGISLFQSFNINISNSNCFPPNISHGMFTVYSKNYTSGSELQIPNYGAVIITCDKNYGLYPPTNKYIVCLRGEWKRDVPQCVRKCRQLKSSSVDFECNLNGYPHDCNSELIENTIVSMKCKPYYYMPFGNSTNTNTTCKNGQWREPVINCIPECGRRYTTILKPFIVSGQSTKHGHYPWHVAIYKRIIETNKRQFICSGSIINTNVILSAAHCFTNNENGKLHDIRLFTICANKYYRNYNFALDTDVQTRDISKIEIPAGYRGEVSVFARDIAIIIVKESFVLSNYVKPICIDWESLFENEQLVHKNYGEVAGWGYMESMTDSNELQTLNIPYIDTNQCIESVPSNFIKYITPDKFCGGYTNGSSVCNGDSGGGLVFKRIENGKHIHYIRGIVSLGPVKKGFCDNFQYSVYTKVSSYLTFIRDVEILNKDLSPEDCLYPNITNGKLLISGHTFKVGDRIPNNSTGIFECEQQHELHPYIVQTTCRNGNWTTKIPSCIRSNDCQVKFNNKPGQCTLLKDCPEAIVELKLGKRPHLCGIEGTEPVVCCSKILSAAENLQRISRRKCQDYSNRVYGLKVVDINDTNTQCFTGNNQRKYDLPSYAHMGLIGFDHNGKLFWKCSGILISEQFVLTAAHCCFDQPFSPAVLVRFGDSEMNTNNYEIQDIKIIDVFLHPALNSTQQYNDIALLKLEKPVKFTDRVRPACLPILNYIHDSKDYLITGWSLENKNFNTKPSLIHSSRIEFIPYDNCSTKINTYRQFRKGIDSDTQICLTDNENMCKMFGGAAMQIHDSNVYCMYNIIGLFSFGESSCLPEPNIFTKIAPYIDWIESIVWS